MVGRFESPEFKAEVAKQDARFAKEAEVPHWQPWLPRVCLVALLLLGVAMRSRSFSWGHLSTGEPDQPTSPPASASAPSPRPPAEGAAPGVASAAGAPEESDGGLYMATFGRTAGADAGPGARPAEAEGPSAGAQSRHSVLLTDNRGSMRPDFTLLGLVVAVLVLCIWPSVAGSPAAAGQPYGAAGGWGAGGGCAAGAGGVVQSPWASTSPSFPGAAAAPPGGWIPGAGAPGALGWQGTGAAGSDPLRNGLAAGLPSEQEAADTSAAFGSRLQRWALAVMQYVHREVINPLLTELEASDRMWHQALAKRGWQLTFEEPRYPQQLGLIGNTAQQLSVFDKQLPPQLCDDPQAAGLWQRRQRCEKFLVLRGFEAARQYVLDRLRQWQQRGPTSPIQHDWRPSPAQPTDGHILENLIIAALSCHVEGFEQCFLATAPTGQPTVAYLRQVTDQSFTPRPPPHYEVVTTARVWRLRPGSNNLPEALGILLQTLKLQSRSYATFPEALRQALDGADGPFGGFSGVMDWMRRGWGGPSWGA